MKSASGGSPDRREAKDSVVPVVAHIEALANEVDPDRELERARRLLGAELAVLVGIVASHEGKVALPEHPNRGHAAARGKREDEDPVEVGVRHVDEAAV